MSEHPEPQDDVRWLDTPAAGRRIHNILIGVCAVLLGMDFAYHKHVHFDFEGWHGFYALAGFISYVGLVTAAKGLRKIVKRREDYYE